MRRLLFLLDAPVVAVGIGGLILGPLTGDDMLPEAALILAFGLFIFASAWVLT